MKIVPAFLRRRVRDLSSRFQLQNTQKGYKNFFWAFHFGKIDLGPWLASFIPLRIIFLRFLPVTSCFEAIRLHDCAFVK